MYKIISISNNFPETENTNFNSGLSLTDFDIVIIDPTDVKSSFPQTKLEQDNKLYVSLQNSHVLSDLFSLRQSELSALLNSGKMIVSFLEPLYEVRLNQPLFKNQTKVHNYSWLPDDAKVRFTNRLITGSGAGLKVIDRKHLFAPYFLALQKEINFNAYVDILTDSFDLGDAFISNSANQVVGFSLRISRGIVVFLPKYNLNEENNKKFMGVLLQIAKKFFGAEIKSPAPDWLNPFVIPGVKILDDEIGNVEKAMLELSASKSEIESRRDHLNEYKFLLYEQGHILERKVLDALRLMRFEANTVSGENTDFDVILESKEGRAIAEVEGKDDSAIHKDKIDQLLSAINQDAEQKGAFAKGVLVGNHYRLKPIDQREEPFTNTVVNLAKQYHYALVVTVDLYRTVVYILEHPEDEDYKTACRNTIFAADGSIVEFPVPKENTE